MLTARLTHVHTDHTCAARRNHTTLCHPVLTRTHTPARPPRGPGAPPPCPPPPQTCPHGLAAHAVTHSFRLATRSFRLATRCHALLPPCHASFCLTARSFHLATRSLRLATRSFRLARRTGEVLVGYRRARERESESAPMPPVHRKLRPPAPRRSHRAPRELLQLQSVPRRLAVHLHCRASRDAAAAGAAAELGANPLR